MSRSRVCRSDAPADLEERWRTIEGKILAAAHLLERGGALSLKDDRGGPVWRLRFRDRSPTGKLVERTIRIGKNPELVRRARELLERCHQRGAWRTEIAGLSRLSAVAVATVKRTIAREGRSAGHKRSRRKRPMGMVLKEPELL